MLAAQRFPWDFAGIVANSPGIALGEMVMNLLWDNRAFTDKDGQALLGPADLQVLHAPVVDKCDLNDGLKDGLIGDPRQCDFNPGALRCKGSGHSGCLTAAQVEAAKKIYRGPITAKGEPLAMPLALKGSELTWPTWYGAAVPGAPKFSYRTWAADWIRYIYFQPNPGPSWQPEAFDFERDYKRLGLGEGMDPVNPDLPRLKAAGSKFLLVGGWNDSIVGPLRIVDYYETTEKVMGGRAVTQEFFRTFINPGMEHCSGGDGAFAIDYLSYIEAWAEKGQAPDALIASHVTADHPTDSGYARFPLDAAKVQFSRPIYPYPTRTKYLGRGDPNDAANFGPDRP